MPKKSLKTQKISPKKVIRAKKPTRKKSVSAFVLAKSEENPIISPKPENNWESWQTFNPGVILLDNKVHFLYRAIGEDGISRLGYAVSSNGFTIDERLAYPAYEHEVGKRTFNIFSYFSGGSFGGAEDPRPVRVDEEDVLYMTYTACDDGLRVALTSIKIEDFLKKKWKWKKPALISLSGEVHKNWLIFPEKINGKYAILHSIKPNIQIEYVGSLEFDNTECINSFHGGEPQKRCWDKWLRGAGAPPIKTPAGWLLFYHAMDNDWSKYKVGVMLLDLKDPTRVLYRAKEPVQKGKDIFLLYRAMSRPHYHTTAKTRLMVSDIGIAESKDGINFHNRRRFIIPEYEWERFGVEDPRVTKFGDTYYVFYTALSTYPPNAEEIKIGLAISKDLKTVQEKHLITPFNAKAMALFPEKIGGKMWAALTVNTDKPPAKICLASFNKESELWSSEYWNTWYKTFEKSALPLQRKPEDHIEVGAPPIKTENGWLLFYSYIRGYFSPKRVFGVEAVLLDLKDPSKIIARTNYPIFVPEEYYERIGHVPNVIFPSGVTIKDDLVYLYYGATDTTCALAFVSLSDFLKKLLSQGKSSFKFVRAKENPIIISKKENDWEAKAVYNPAAIYLQGKVHILYRAQADDNISVFGYATSADGIHIDFRSSKPVYVPRESFEQKLTTGENSGCEDPRLTKIGNTIYMLYTAFDGQHPPRVALTSILEKDFLNQKWNWAKSALISPPGEDDKDACLFPEKIKGEYVIVHRAGDEIDLSFHPDLRFDGSNWLEEYRWIAPRKGMWDSRKVGIAAPPIKTKESWLVLYHGVSDDGVYRVGAVLTDLRDLTKIISRTDEPIFEPETEYEKVGQILNVVFPCGAVVIDERIFMYYGGADSVVGVATGEIEKLLKFCQSWKC